jgi:hypothetical protein
MNRVNLEHRAREKHSPRKSLMNRFIQQPLMVVLSRVSMIRAKIAAHDNLLSGRLGATGKLRSCF